MVRLLVGSFVVGAWLAGGWAAAAPHQVQARAREDTVWLIFVDDLHIAFRKTGHLRNFLRTIASGLMEPDDLYAARSAGPSALSIDLTSDGTALANAFQRLSGASLRLAESIQARARDEVRYRFKIAIFEAEGMLADSASWPSARRVMLYLSNGYDIPDLGGRLAAFAAAARRANVRVFTFNMQALPGEDAGSAVTATEAARYADATRASLRAMTEGTGGFALLDDRDLAAAVPRIRAALPR